MSTSISGRTNSPVETLGFDVEDLLVSATRYMLGRKTYAVALHCDALAEAWPQLSSWARETIRRDVERAFERDDWARAEGKEHPGRRCGGRGSSRDSYAESAALGLESGRACA